jgi:hypothetical protein
MGLTVDEHLDNGRKLKLAVRLLRDVAATCRCYERQSRQLEDAANALTAQRGWLEARLIEAVGPDAMVEGVPCREVYFGELVEEEVDG